jgi:hypothetical protein
MIRNVFKIVLFLILIFTTYIILFVVNINNSLGNGYYLYNNGGFTGTGISYLKHNKYSTLELPYILDVKHNERYIIAYQLYSYHYSCKNNEQISLENRTRFIIVDKFKNDIFVTFSKKKFKNKKDNLNIKESLYFSLKSNRRLKVLNEVELLYINNNCQEDGSPVILY